MTVIARVLVLVVAVAAAAWFALGIRQSTDTARATALITGPAPLSAADARRASTLLSDAATLNPDQTVGILRGQLALDLRHNAAAVRILLGVTRREPDNLAAWIQLAYAAGRAGDRSILVLTGREISRLFPKLPQH